jgi:hypothetical protein
LTVKRVRKQLFAPKISGVPQDLAMYWVKARKDVPADDAEERRPPGA